MAVNEDVPSSTALEASTTGWGVNAATCCGCECCHAISVPGVQGGSSTHGVPGVQGVAGDAVATLTAKASPHSKPRHPRHSTMGPHHVLHAALAHYVVVQPLLLLRIVSDAYPDRRGGAG